MRAIFTRGAGAILLGSLASLSPNAIANTATGSEDIAGVYGQDSMISLATGYVQPLSQAPATASVLTRADLAALGARTLKDALHLLPGFNVSTADGRTTNITVRGITSRALILVDGIPITRTMLDPWVALDSILLHNVERLEVVRGPGSAIYGADAVAGVINILTRTNTHIPGTEFGVGGGSNGTFDAWLLHSFNIGRLKLSGYANFNGTDGSDRIIEIDAQSLLDQRLGTSASRAPGEIAQKRKSADIRMEATLGDFSMQLAYYDQDPLQTGAGLAYALDPNGEFNSLFEYVQLRHRHEFSDSVLVESFVNVSKVEQDADTLLFPAGAFANDFPDGVISSFFITNDRMQAETTAVALLKRGHKVRFGIGASSNEFDSVKDARNFIMRNGRFVPTGIFAQLGGVGDPTLIGDTKQDIFYAYAQDEWNLANNWRLTGGVRWDRYSDFGSTVNPRVGLVWTVKGNLTAKALYGRSFRTPSVLELQSSGVFSALGNPDLQPTTLEMGELGFDYRGSRFENHSSIFHYNQNDLIQVISNPVPPNRTSYINSGQSEGWGFENELSWRISGDAKASVNYSYQDRIGHDADNNANNRFAPHHIVNLQLQAPVAANWRSSLAARAVLDRERAISDPRPNPNDYVLVNASLARIGIKSMFDVSINVYNLFDKDISEASPSATSLPLDIPLPGRTWLLQLKWNH